MHMRSKFLVNGSLMLALLITAVLGVRPAQRVQDVVFHVSPSGNDANPGTREEPFQSLRRAQEAVRKYKAAGRPLPAGGLTVLLHGGDYPMTESLALELEDSGTATAPLRWSGQRGETARLIGGKFINNFKAVSEPTALRRIQPEYRTRILQADLRALGIADASVSKSELFFKGRYMTLARYPNTDWLTVKDVPQSGPDLKYEGDVENLGATFDGIPAGRHWGRFAYESARPNRWADRGDIWMRGFWCWDWSYAYQKAHKFDKAKSEVYPAEPYHHYGYRKGQRFFFLNVLEELDTPGEWYVDSGTGMLYFWPPEPIQPGDVMFPILESPLITLSGTDYVTIENIRFACSRGHGIAMKGGTGNLIAGCQFTNICDTVVTIDEGSGNGIRSCDIFEVSSGGIQINGGDRASLAPANHFAVNNHVHHYSRSQKSGTTGVSVSGVGNRMANNLVHDAPHHALGSGGNDNVIEFNEVHDVIQETGDAGALHIGRDWTMRGNKIQFNFWHHIRGPKLEGSAFTSAISVYLDDMWSGTFVYGNIFHDCDWAVLIGGGHDNIIENNLMSKCGLGFSGDRRSLGWGRLSFAKGGSARMFERLAAVPYKLEPWRTKYPNLVNILENEPLISKGNLITRNVFSGETWMLMIDGADFSNYQVTQNVIAAENLARWQFEIGGERKTIPFGEENLTKQLEGLGNIMVRTNPGFVETEAGELRLSDNSPAFSLGFKPIPYENIGLFVDQWRTALPSRPRRQPEGEPELLEEGSPHMKYLFDLALPAGLFALLMACAAPTSREPDAYSVDERQMKEAMELFQAEPPVTILANTHPDAQWFPKAGLGLFMHWGIHSVAGIQPSWAMIKNYPAGGDSNFHPPEKYYALASKFDPQNYDPGKWMAAARAAGFTYAVLTTKHHDGYALWPTKYGDMNTRRYLGGRDLIKPYVEACRKHGLKVGFYFSPRDWHYPNYPLDDVDFDYSKRLKFRPIRDPIQNELNFEKFYAYTIGQLRELLTQYGKIDVLWFDGISWHPFKDIRTRQTLAWVRRLQPGIVINPRWGDMGDFETPEIELPQGRPQGWWESCYIWPKGHWGYVPSEDFQPLSWVLETLVRCRMWGGNLLLNVGPRPDGTMPDAFYQYSRELAQWMAHSGESLIGAGSSPDDSRSNVPITRRKGVWYLHLLYKHRGPAELKEVPAPRTIKLLRTGQSIPFRGTRTLVLEVPETARTSLDDVVGVYWDQEPETQ